MIVDFRRNPPALPHSPPWTALWLQRSIQVPGHHHLPGPEMGQSHWVHGEKDPAETVLPSPAEEVQPATGAADTVLLYHHWIHPLHINNCLVQLSYQIWPQKTTEDSPDCWVNHWYNPPHSPRTVLFHQKGWQNISGPLTSSALPLWTVTVWSTLQNSEHQNDQTQKQILPSRNPSHEHLTLNVEHTTLLYIEWMNEWGIYIVLYCVLLCTQSTLQSCGGVSPQPPPVCSIHLDDATAATGQRRQCVHHTPATGEDERESYIIYSITHTYFHFNLHISYLYIHNLYIILYLYINPVLSCLLSFYCTVELLSL